MARIYLKVGSGTELIFSNEQGVGAGMQNDPADVMLVQIFLAALLNNQELLKLGVRLTPPDGPKLKVSGVWDATSQKYLQRWEEIDFAADPHRGSSIRFPGKVVPVQKGGKKIVAMNQMCVDVFGHTRHRSLALDQAVRPPLFDKLFFRS